ncbi:MAG: pantoate--beta-alanine ligase [Bdellovibrionales bacterium]
MTVIRTLPELREWRTQTTDRPLGFVPTMGALHDGHLELVRIAQKKTSEVIVSLFVNPTQFNDPQDFQTYPRTEANDLALLEKVGVSAVFIPSPHVVYPSGNDMKINEEEISSMLCGRFRPGHFSGVLTVVMKLFQMVQPTHAFFGEKDYQQLKIIQKLVSEFFLPIEIVPCPTVREPDGLAMSSRNVRLSPAERELAPQLFQILSRAPSSDQAEQDLSEAGFNVEYVEEHWGRRLAAAHLGKVRLIDNVEV